MSTIASARSTANFLIDLQPPGERRGHTGRGPRYRKLEDVQATYFEHLRAEAVNKLKGHYNLPNGLTEQVADLVVAFMKEHPRISALTNAVVHEVMVNMARHLMIGGNEIKSRLATAHGGSRLKDVFSGRQYKRFHKLLNDLAWFEVASFCKLPICSLHSTRRYRGTNQQVARRGERTRTNSHCHV